MKRYGKFNTLDELLAHNMPLMREDRKQREQRRKERGIKSSIDLEKGKTEEQKKHIEELLSLLYTMEHMSKAEVKELSKKYDEELREAKAVREMEEKGKSEEKQ